MYKHQNTEDSILFKPSFKIFPLGRLTHIKRKFTGKNV